MRLQICKLRFLIWKIILVNKIILKMGRFINILRIGIAISLVIHLERWKLIIIANMIENIIIMLLNDSWIFSLICYCFILFFNHLGLVYLYLQFHIQLLYQLFKLIYLIPFFFVFFHYIFHIFSYFFIKVFLIIVFHFFLDHLL